MNNVVHVEVEIVVLISIGVGLGDVDWYCDTIDFLGVFLNHIGGDLGVLVCKPRTSITNRLERWIWMDCACIVSFLYPVCMDALSYTI